MKSEKISTLFLDIGGVLLTNGWETESRKKAAEYFKLDFDEMEPRHRMAFDTYELGKSTLDEYFDRAVFFRQRDFSRDDFKNFMFSQSEELEGLNFFLKVKSQYQLRVIAVSNEPFDLNEYRIQKFGLRRLFDAFISSCYVHLRKPDSEIFRMACAVSATPAKNALYVDDREMLIEVGLKLGLNCLHYQGVDSAKVELSKFGLSPA